MKIFISFILFFFATQFVSGQFGAHREITESFASYRTKSVDLDSDGLLDLVGCSGVGRKIAWFKNLGGNTFSTIKHITTDFYAADIAIADYDNDGDLDVAATSSQENKVVWYRNLGQGTFGDKLLITGSLVGADYILSDDFNNDGTQDIVIRRNSGSPQLYWLANIGGTFGAPQLIVSTAAVSGDVRSGDINGDGNVDLVVASFFTNKLTWYPNQGNGVFGAEIIISSATSELHFFQLVDLDNDGDLDIAATYSQAGGGIKWYRNTGGVFSSQIIIFSGIGAFNNILTGDMNNDGRQDIVTSRGAVFNFYLIENLGNDQFSVPQVFYSNSSTSNVLALGDFNADGFLDVASHVAYNTYIHYNSTFATFTNHQRICETEYLLKSIHLNDFDGDGLDDVLACDNYGERVSWYRNNADGTFETREILHQGIENDYTYDVTSGDLDNDGDNDALMVAFYDNTIAWFENTAGVLGPRQIISNTAANPADIELADIDQDGLLDLVVVFLGNATIQWYKNLGGGSFGSPQFICGSGNLTSLRIGDFNNDGYPDLLFENTLPLTDMIILSLNLGTGSFTTPQHIHPGYGEEFTSINAGDIDNDGDLDVLFTAFASSIGKIGWYENLGGGTFDPINNVFQTGSFGYNEAVTSDVDADGDLDIISGAGSVLSWNENIGNATFGSAHIFDQSLNQLFRILMSDLDGNGTPDPIVASNGSSKISWFQNLFNSDYGLKGTVYYDQNQSGSRDSTETGIALVGATLTPSSTIGFSSFNGDYFFYVDSGTYTVNHSLTDTLWNLTSPFSSYTETINSSFPLADSLDFGFYPDTIVTIIHPELTGGFPRCNNQVNYWIGVTNSGTTLPSGVICLELDSAITYLYASEVYDSIVGNKIYWSYDSLDYEGGQVFYAVVEMPDFTSFGDTLQSFLTVTELDSLGNQTYTNTDELNQILVCAYDPNDKTVTPQGIGQEGYITQEDYFLEYLIRFQNTGNDTAINVVIQDQLSANLDWGSFELLSTSHPVSTTINGFGQVTFEFDNIYLPDSLINEPESHGFVKFKINLIDSLPPDSQIVNSSEIYFDYNPAVITNSVINTIYNCEDINIELTNTTICLGASIEGSLPANAFTNDLWQLDTTVLSTSAELDWTPDSVGTYALYVARDNALCFLDSVITISVLPMIAPSNVNVEICAGDSVFLQNAYRATSGIYIDTLLSNLACDSIVITDLTVNPLQTSTNALTICAGDSVFLQNAYRLTSGIFIDTFLSISTCDSVVITNLTVDPFLSSMNTVTICEGDSLLIFNTYQNTSATYVSDTLTSSAGCDSLAYINLTVIPMQTANTNATICAGDSLLIGGNYQTTSGQYQDTVPSSLGCDSLVVINLFVSPPIFSTLDSTICGGNSIVLNGNVYSTSGIYNVVFPSVSGCDSTVQLTLDVQQVDVTVANTSPTLSASNGNATAYQWVDCQTNFSPIANETDQEFTPTANGNYAVIITETTCVDTSSCYLISNVGLDHETLENNLLVIPNPTTSEVVITMKNSIEATIEIFDAKGKLLNTLNVVNGEKVSLANYEMGVYYLRIVTDKGSYIAPVMKH